MKSTKRENTARDYVDENSLRFELTAVNLKEKYKKTNSDELIEMFNDRKELRILEVKKELENPKLSQKDIDYLENELERLKELTIFAQNKEIFGSMVLLITRNLAKKSCFAGYTLNWKDEFFSRAIEHCFKYCHNFDENKISPRSGAKVKAFAYITQIVYTAFLDVISRRKKEQERLKMMCSLSESDKERTGYVSYDKTSRYRKRITFDFDVLDSDKIDKEYESVKNYMKNVDEYHVLKSEIFLLSKTKNDGYEKEERTMLGEFDRVTQEINSFKKKYKCDGKPQEIELTCNEFGEVSLSSVLKQFEDLGVSCIITKNKVPKKFDDLVDF